MKHKKKRASIAAPSNGRSASTNLRLYAQTRKVLRAHYAAKYRAHRSAH